MSDGKIMLKGIAYGGGTEINDNAVANDATWSSKRIVSMLPTESASGAVASFETPLTLPLVSLVADIDYKDTTGFNAVNVTRAGKNVFDVSLLEWEAGVLDDNGQPVVATESHYTKSFTAVCSGGWVFTGTFRVPNINNRIYFYDKDKQWISRTTGTSVYPFKFTVPANCRYIRIQCSSTITTADDWQIELGTTATAYEPYTATTSTINLGGTIYGGSVDITNGIVTSTKAQDGSDLPDPVVTTITPTEINTLEGVNNIWADTGDTSVEFKQDIQTYIDSRLSSGTRTLSLAKAPVETKEETKQEEQEEQNDDAQR